VNYKQPHHYHGRPTGSTVVLKVVNVLCEDDGNDKVRKGHADGADGEDGFAAEPVDVKHCWDWKGGLVWNDGNKKWQEETLDILVAMNITIPTTPVASRDVVFPVRPICLKIWGA